MPDIMHQVTIKATPKALYAAITKQKGLAAWWTTDTLAESKVGTISEFGFGRKDTVIKMQVEELVPFTKVRWRCIGGIEEWEHTQLIFELQGKGKRTVLLFRHLGWRSTDGVLALCSFDWAHYLMSLRSLVETGTGNPHQAKV